MTLLLPSSFGALQDLGALSVAQQRMSTMMVLHVKVQRSFGEVNFVVSTHASASIVTVSIPSVALSPIMLTFHQVQDNFLVSTVSIMKILL